MSLQLRGSILIYGNRVEPHRHNRGRSLWPTSVVQERGCFPQPKVSISATLSTFLILKPHSCWWLISAALLRGVALAFLRQTAGLVYCTHLIMKWKGRCKRQIDYKLFYEYLFLHGGDLKIYKQMYTVAACSSEGFFQCFKTMWRHTRSQWLQFMLEDGNKGGQRIAGLWCQTHPVRLPCSTMLCISEEDDCGSSGRWTTGWKHTPLDKQHHMLPCKGQSLFVLVIFCSVCWPTSLRVQTFVPLQLIKVLLPSSGHNHCNVEKILQGC